MKMTYTPGRLIARRHTLGFSIEDLAGALDVDPRTVRRWEAGQSPIPDGVAHEVEQLMGRLAARFAEYHQAHESGAPIRIPRGDAIAAAAAGLVLWMDPAAVIDVDPA